MLRAICSSSLRCRPQEDPKPWVLTPGPGPSVQPATLHHPPIALTPSLCHRPCKAHPFLFRSLSNDPCLLSLPNGPDLMKPGGPSNNPPLLGSPRDPVCISAVSDLGPDPIFLRKVDQTDVASSPGDWEFLTYSNWPPRHPFISMPDPYSCASCLWLASILIGPFLCFAGVSS